MRRAEADPSSGSAGKRQDNNKKEVLYTIDRFEIDHAVAKIDGKSGLLDVNGNKAVPCIYDRIVPIGRFADDYHYIFPLMRLAKASWQSGKTESAASSTRRIS